MGWGLLFGADYIEIAVNFSEILSHFVLLLPSLLAIVLFGYFGDMGFELLIKFLVFFFFILLYGVLRFFLSQISDDLRVVVKG